jgi:hypothetical protein
MTTGMLGDATWLRDPRYAYDAIGGHPDHRRLERRSPQLRSFAYDALDRLATAEAIGGITGTYGLETYTYNGIGNLTSEAGLAYTYPSAIEPHPHVATSGGRHTLHPDA